MDDTALEGIHRTLIDIQILMHRMLGTRLSKKEASAWLGCCPNTLTRWVQEGKVPAPGVGKKWLLADLMQHGR